MRYSAEGIAEATGLSQICRLSGLSEERAEELLKLITTKTDTLPDTKELENLDFALASMAIKTGVTRHAGTIEKTYTPLGEAYLQEGKDLSLVKKTVITGGALIHTERIKEISAYGLYDIAEPTSLKPLETEVLVDKNYILSAMGLLSQYEPDIALRLMKKELISYGTAK